MLFPKEKLKGTFYMPFSNPKEIKHLFDEVANTLVGEKGFIPTFNEEDINNLPKIDSFPDIPLKDLTHLFWISIDNFDSRDLDQITYAEKIDDKTSRIFCGIADVDHFIPFDSKIDLVSRNNTTSIYTPFKIFPMIPGKFCYDLSSLVPNQDRRAVVIQFIVDETGRMQLEEIYLALVRNKAKLIYEQVSNWLDNQVKIPNIECDESILYKQITFQNSISKKIFNWREKKGALNFSVAQGETIIEKGIPIGIKEKKQTTAHKIIENLMIATNVCVAQFMIHKQLPLIRRIVKTPKRWDRIIDLAKEKDYTLPDQPDAKSLQKFLYEQEKKDPIHFPDLSLSIIKLIGRGEYVLALPHQKSIGHFDLALIDYSHSTAPNRRYPDLMMQRLIKCSLSGISIPYSVETLEKIAANCTAKEEAAAKIERHLYKSFAALILSQEIGKVFPAIVTGKSESGTWIRLKDLPVEGKLVSGFEKYDVGDPINAQLKHVDIEKGYIDFEKMRKK